MDRFKSLSRSLRLFLGSFCTVAAPIVLLRDSWVHWCHGGRETGGDHVKCGLRVPLQYTVLYSLLFRRTCSWKYIFRIATINKWRNIFASWGIFPVTVNALAYGSGAATGVLSADAHNDLNLLSADTDDVVMSWGIPIDVKGIACSDKHGNYNPPLQFLLALLWSMFQPSAFILRPLTLCLKAVDSRCLSSCSTAV